MNVLYVALLLVSASENRAIELLNQASRAQAQLDQDYCDSTALKSTRDDLHVRYRAQVDKWIKTFGGDRLKIMRAVPVVVTVTAVSCPVSQDVAAKEMELGIKQLEAIEG